MELLASTSFDCEENKRTHLKLAVSHLSPIYLPFISHQVIWWLAVGVNVSMNGCLSLSKSPWPWIEEAFKETDEWTSHVQGCVAVHFWATPQTFLSDHLHMYVCDFPVDHKLLQTAHISICVKLTQSLCRLREKNRRICNNQARSCHIRSGAWQFFLC